MTEPPAEFQGFIKQKRMQALQLGGPGVLVGAAVASLAAAVNGDFGAVLPTLQGCAAFGTFSALFAAVASKLEKNEK